MAIEETTYLPYDERKIKALKPYDIDSYIQTLEPN
jgi:hypothetical protein